MPFVTRKSLLTLSILSGVALAAAAGFVWSGIYNIGADDTHTRPVYSTLQALRERSIEVRANKLQVPADLDDPDLVGIVLAEQRLRPQRAGLVRGHDPGLDG